MTSVDESTASPADPLTRRRGRYAKTEGTRTAILDAALEVFAQGGFRAGSLRDIATRVNMSEAGLLHHFSSKSALLSAVLERRDGHAEQFVPTVSTDGAASVRGLIDLARYNASEPGVVELYCTLSAEATSSDHPAHDYFVQRYQRTRGTLLEAFGQLYAQGLLREGVEPTAAARSTIAVMDGLQVQWLLDRSQLDMAEELRTFLRRLTTIDL
jgi:AcrR family transcriptional regulator